MRERIHRIWQLIAFEGTRRRVGSGSMLVQLDTIDPSSCSDSGVDGDMSDVLTVSHLTSFTATFRDQNCK